MNPPPSFSVVTPVYRTDPAILRAAIASVLHQTYPQWELLLILDGPQPSAVRDIAEEATTMDNRVTVLHLPEHAGISAATNVGVEGARGEYVGFLDHDDLLEPDALEKVRSTIHRAAYLPDLLYTDHDKIDEGGRRYEPEFKPDWSPETLLSSCYIGHFKVVRRDTLLALGGFRKEYDGAQDYDFLLRLAERTPRVCHIPHILYHWRRTPTSTASSASAKSTSIERGLRALQEALVRRKKRVRATRPPFSHQHIIGVYSLLWNPEDVLEHVTIVIPTKDRLDLLGPCLRSIRSKTTYPRYEILIVNNGEANRQLLELLEREGVRRLDCPTNTFNFSHLLSSAIEHVRTPFVLFLNDDTEVLSRDWLLQMLGTMTLDDAIGAVGAKLLYPSGLVQHSGVLLGLNDSTAGHANRGLPGDDSGYRNANRALRNYTAVTAACMLTRTGLFREVGGFDQERFSIAYNDVDYCLKLLARGYRSVVQPDALLLHHQAATRGGSFHPDAEYASRAALRRVWGPLLRQDPYYHPHLSRHNEHVPLRNYPPGKRLLLVSHNLAHEGASLSLFDLAVGLKKRHYHIEVAAPKTGPLADPYRESGIAIHIGRRGGAHPLFSLNRDIFDILFLNTITSYLLLQNADVAAHPTIWCIRESERDTYMRTLTGFSQNLFSVASRVLFVAEATRDIYRDLDRGHFRNIHTGIDSARIDAASLVHDRAAIRHSLGIAPGDTVLATIGTLCPRKGQRGIVEAATMLLPSYPSLHFLFVGGGTGSTYEEEFRKQVRRSGLRHRIHIIDTTPDIDHYYRASDILVCNSSIESFPRVILEAMAWGLPIVATNIFGIPEQVRDGQDALLVPPENPPALANALRRLLQDNALRATLAGNARRRVEEYFNLDRMIDQYEELFADVVPFMKTSQHATRHDPPLASVWSPGTAGATHRGREGATGALSYSL